MADETNIGQDLMNIPLGEMVRSIAMAIADAQFQLDQSSLTMAEFMSGQKTLVNADGKITDKVDTRIYFGYTVDPKEGRVPQRLSMMELGFIPNFYQFVDTVIEIKLALRVNKSKGPDGGTLLTSTPVDASYASSYSYSADLAAVFKTKLVPIPPPSALEERLRQLVEQGRASQEAANPPAVNPTAMSQTSTTG